VHAVLRAAVTGLTVGAVGLGSAWGAAVLTTPPLPSAPAAVSGAAGTPGTPGGAVGAG
jgi:hypothetical protein